MTDQAHPNAGKTCKCGRGKASGYDGKCGHCRTGRERKAYQRMRDGWTRAEVEQGYRHRKVEKRPSNPSPQDIAIARGTIMRFTPARPMLVGPIVYRQLSSYSELSDVMDRVMINPQLPLEGKP